MSPAARLADLFAAARRDGQHFGDAWPEAVETVLASEPDERERAAWRAALAGTRSAWLSAWQRESIAGRPLLALIAVAADPDRRPIDAAGECERCGASLEGLDPRSRYCSRPCARAAGGERRRAAA